MKRTNTVTWVDGRVITKLMTQLQISLMDYQKDAYDIIENNKPIAGGDFQVIIDAINLRNKLDLVIEQSKIKNTMAGRSGD